MARKLRLSVSGMKTYLTCARRYFYYRHPDIPNHTDYPRLLGIAVHKHIAQLYRPTKDPRPFYYRSEQSYRGAWFNRWKRELDEAVESERLLARTTELDDEFGRIGAICIDKYWETNITLSRPLQVEQRFEHSFNPTLSLIGVMDQVRTVPIKYIEKHRPELITNGQLHPDYDPVAIVDLKTNQYDFDTERLKDPTESEKMRSQYNLHEDLQATAYTFLYQQATGKKPIGFIWYHLRSGSTFFTFRDESDFLNLFLVIDHVVDNLQAQSFPKNSTDNNCFHCDFVRECWEKNIFPISAAEKLSGELVGADFIPNLIEVDPVIQKRMKLKIPRIVRPEPETPSSKVSVLRNLPWREESSTLVTAE